MKGNEGGQAELPEHLEVLDALMNNNLSLSTMNAVEEIQTAIERLSLSERGRLAQWFNGWEDDDWDKEMASDFGPGGRYENVPRRIEEEIERGPLLDLP